MMASRRRLIAVDGGDTRHPVSKRRQDAENGPFILQFELENV